MADVKPEYISDVQEFETRDVRQQKTARAIRLAESVRLGLTVLTLVSGVTIVATAADTLAVYNKTHLGQDFFLNLWPTKFDLRPTTALVICGTIVCIAGAISLIASKTKPIRKNTFVHNSVSILTPAVCLVASLIGASFFYGVNTSDTVFSLQSWTCQLSGINMDVAPHWGTLCRESKAALYLTVMLIPLEVLVLGIVAWVVSAEKKQACSQDRKGTSTMS